MKEFKQGSKKQDILDHLKKGKSITPLEALTQYGSFRLSAVIFNIRELGYETHTEMMHDMENTYARYTIPMFVKRRELEQLCGAEWSDLNFLNYNKQKKHNIEITDDNIDEVIQKVKSGLYFVTPF